MANMFTVRNLPKGAQARLRTYMRKHNLKTGEALNCIILRATDSEDEKKPYTLRDLGKFVFHGKDKYGSMHVDDVVYGINRRGHVSR